MTPITPSGVATRSIESPFGRSNRASTRPTGSGRAAMASRPLAMASTRERSRASRSRKAGVVPLALADAMSFPLAARMSLSLARIVAAAWRRARFFVSVEASESACAAARAARPIPAITPVASASPLRSSMRLRLSIRSPRRCGKLAAGDDHVVAMNNRRAPRSAEQAQDILRIASGDQDRLARVIADKTAPDLGRAGIPDQDAIAAGEITLDSRHAGGQQALAIRDCHCCSGIDMQGAARLQ